MPLKQLAKLCCLILPFNFIAIQGLMFYFYSKLKKPMASGSHQSHSTGHRLPNEKHYYEWVFHRPHTQNRKHAKFVSKH